MCVTASKLIVLVLVLSNGRRCSWGQRQADYIWGQKVKGQRSCWDQMWSKITCSKKCICSAKAYRSTFVTEDHLRVIIIIIIIIIIFRAHSTKPQAEILKLNNVNGCNDISFGDHSILEGDRISPLKSHGQALEEELLFPWCPQW